MSVSTSNSETVTYECEGPDCTREFEHGKAVDHEYCSVECSLRDDGRNLLRNIKFDHRFCFGCFKKLKEVSKPPERTPEFVIGYQYLTPNAIHAEIESRGHVEAADEAVRRQVKQRERAPSPADSLVVIGTSCECGTTDHQDPWMRDAATTDVTAAARRLCEVLAFQARERQHNKQVAATTLVQTLTETVREQGRLDWALAVGRAVDD
jgi:hypothetical protein